MLRLSFVILLLLISPVVFAQQANPLPIVQQKMQALKWLTGKWQGTASIKGQDGQKQEVKHTLAFVNNLDNTVLLLNESLMQGQDKVAQNIGLLGYNVLQSKYNLQAYTNDGAYIDAYVEVLEKKIIWRIHFSGHIIRYTARLNEKGQWYQTGEMSADEGKIWAPFFESTLTRIN
ncbi:hypothetical protein [Adhaeribacter rhizoryzae]|uniref:DUF1579 domain-containing protein n=1 Tax=Adhaeribacter rhizoryzae TaxID=2607907 RepID=A0A5M6DLZ3_9BACT|nr:hypothetical protein [Adhaeribacter rhizoryzae]KAA5546385.1 hypothetical protein F0145_10840 [Adhaeribacter rhizoryzae]